MRLPCLEVHGANAGDPDPTPVSRHLMDQGPHRQSPRGISRWPGSPVHAPQSPQNGRWCSLSVGLEVESQSMGHVPRQDQVLVVTSLVHVTPGVVDAVPSMVTKLL